ncbi:hypothetical protein SEA_ATUIN_229 [Arthrobacter phage Atuin]|nr:hypothetical protein SEA_ATUIN_28 [Arthrobacter phage Atuin]
MSQTNSLLTLWRNRVRYNLEEIAEINGEDDVREAQLITEAITLMECADGLEQALKAEKAAATPPLTLSPTKPVNKELSFWDHLGDALTFRPPRY